jgi:nitrite reductase/ring-hydroxylating ferredoxin subunit
VTGSHGGPPGATKYVVARAEDIPDGARMLVEVGGREVGVFKVKGEFFAVLNRCPHLGGPLCRGQLLNTVVSPVPGDVSLDESEDLITCPWHGWEFDLRTGQSYWNPEHLRARKFPVGVEAGAALAVYLEQGDGDRIPGPYQAETLPVSIESDYVVVTMRSAPRPAEPVPAAEPASSSGGSQ